MKKIKVNGINLAYEVEGDGPALLFIHGLGSCAPDWEAQVPEFAKRYKVISFDLRGHGESDRPAGPYSMQMFASDAAGLLRELDITSAHVVGISLGGGIAFQMSIDYPAMMKTLTVVNSAPEAILRTFRQKFMIWQRFVVVRLMGLPKMGTILAPHLFPDPKQGALRDSFAQRFARNDKPSYLATLRALLGWGMTDKLGQIACPTLIIAADQDYTPLSIKEEYVKKIPKARLAVVPDSHHALPMEKPEQFNAVLAEFLAANP